MSITVPKIHIDLFIYNVVFSLENLFDTIFESSHSHKSSCLSNFSAKMFTSCYQTNSFYRFSTFLKIIDDGCTGIIFKTLDSFSMKFVIGSPFSIHAAALSYQYSFVLLFRSVTMYCQLLFCEKAYSIYLFHSSLSISLFLFLFLYVVQIFNHHVRISPSFTVCNYVLRLVFNVYIVVVSLENLFDTIFESSHSHKSSCLSNFSAKMFTSCYQTNSFFRFITL